VEFFEDSTFEINIWDVKDEVSMESEERKKRFVALLDRLVEESDGIKSKLAKKLEIIPSRLTAWLQGKVDPASIEVLVFDRIANILFLPTDSLIESLGILQLEKNDKDSLNRFRNLIEEMLAGQTQEQLGKRLGVSQKTISGWINPDQSLEPSKMPIGTIALIAKERGWTVERIIAYLGLKDRQKLDENLLSEIQSLTSQLSFPGQVKLQIWFSQEFESKLKNIDTQILAKDSTKNLNDSFISTSKSPFKNHTVYILLDTKDLTIASQYTANFIINLQTNPDNIKIASITQFEEVKEDLDLIIFDIETNSSNIIELINQISFDGDIVIFTSPEVEEEVREQLEDKVTDIVLKPIDWHSLKDKPYFS